MTEEAAYKSPLCVRYLFECTVTPSGPPSGRYADLSPLQILRLRYLAIFSIAARSCEIFSYQEAEAALNGHLHGLADPSPSR